MATAPKKKNTKNVDIYNPFGGVSLTELTFFTKRMALMLNSGIAIIEALSIARQGTTGKLKKVLGTIIPSVTSGHPFGQTLGNYPHDFSPMFISTIRAGEQSGNLAESLEFLSKQLDKERILRSKIKGAMLYPTIVLTAAGILGAAMAYLVLPKITPLFSALRIELPLSTRLLIFVSTLLKDHGAIVLPSLAFCIIGIIFVLRQKFSQPLIHWITLKIPLIGKMNHYANLSRFCRNLGTLLKSGINIDEALEITQTTVSNYYYRRALAQIARQSSGTQVSENLKNYPELFPNIIVQMIHVGEQSGNLDDTLLYLADYYDEEVDGLANQLPSILEPVMLLGIGLVVAFLAIAIMTPIFKATGGIRQ